MCVRVFFWPFLLETRECCSREVTGTDSNTQHYEPFVAIAILFAIRLPRALIRSFAFTLPNTYQYWYSIDIGNG